MNPLLCLEVASFSPFSLSICGILLSLHLSFKLNDRLGWLVELLVKKNIKAAKWIIEEILNEAAIKQVAVDV